MVRPLGPKWVAKPWAARMALLGLPCGAGWNTLREGYTKKTTKHRPWGLFSNVDYSSRCLNGFKHKRCLAIPLPRTPITTRHRQDLGSWHRNLGTDKLIRRGAAGNIVSSRIPSFSATPPAIHNESRNCNCRRLRHSPSLLRWADGSRAESVGTKGLGGLQGPSSAVPQWHLIPEVDSSWHYGPRKHSEPLKHNSKLFCSPHHALQWPIFPDSFPDPWQHTKVVDAPKCRW